MLSRSDIPGRPETQVGRWHAMHNRRMDEREKAGQGGEAVGLADESRGLRGNAVPPALRRLSIGAFASVARSSCRYHI
jgi:hypothetical protein